MKVDEIIAKAEVFSMSFIAKISDASEQPARKQTFFLDNQEELQKYMGALQKIITSYNEQAAREEDDEVLLNKATEISDKLKEAITKYQSELMISDSVTEEDTTASLTQETISDAMKTNKTTQEISANMQAIAEQQKNQIAFNYALVCDGQINMIAATSKSQLNDSINAIAGNGNFKDIALYKMQFTPVQLQKKTILTV